jgi:hypothetical protein
MLSIGIRASRESKVVALRFASSGTDVARNGCAEFDGRFFAANVWRANFPVRQSARDGILNCVGCVFLSEMTEHHRTRPNLPDRIGNTLPGDIGS